MRSVAAVRRIRTVAIALLAAAALAEARAAPSRAADLLTTADEAYAARGVERVPFDPGAADLSPRDARFLAALFAVTDEAVLLNANALRWLASDGRRGLHYLDYRADLDALLARLRALEAPDGAAAPRDLVAEALRHQHDFLGAWHAAVRERRAFASQLTHEYAWHDDPLRARQKLLRAYAELRALYPGAGERAHRAFEAHLHALDLGP